MTASLVPRRKLTHAGRSRFTSRSAGFTMVELIVVMVVIGILGAIGAGRFFNRSGFDAAAFAEQSAAMLRYAQKLAIAQRRPVYMQASTSGLSLCYTSASPCGTADRVPAPSGANSGSAGTRTFCTGGGAYDPAWDCEGVPTGTTLNLNSAAPGNMYFDGLGRPYVAGDTGDSSFVALTLTIRGDDVTRTVSVARETGYVF